MKNRLRTKQKGFFLNISQENLYFLWRKLKRWYNNNDHALEIINISAKSDKIKVDFGEITEIIRILGDFQK